ncbi:restriction endonuclease [Streptomyces sp. HMX112]|uniref:restriction endonuclease n=1 Tax=Streptomyces sp. HMX112 TaxID=3390850 RepID=UPI003A808499
MTIPIRRSRPARPPTRRPGPRLRDVTLGFGLVAIVVCGVAATAKAVGGDSGQLPAAVLALVVFTAATAAVVRAGRRRRARAPYAVPAGGPAAVPGRPAEDAGSAGPAQYLAPVAPAEPAGGPAPDEPVAYVDYAAMDGAAFEQAIAELCVRDGCTDVEVVGGAGDLGADVVATAPDGRRVVIQCKCYGPSHKVGSQDVQRFGGTCFAVHGAHVAAVVTTSEFTEPAADYAGQCGILCVDHRALHAWTEGTGPAPWYAPPLAEGL